MGCIRVGFVFSGMMFVLLCIALQLFWRVTLANFPKICFLSSNLTMNSSATAVIALLSYVKEHQMIYSLVV